jgi:type II secretory pathway predicted ATPase ExeA
VQDKIIKSFGLSESPFDLTADPEFFYTNPSYQEAFLALRYGIKLRKGVSTLTGESGTGKTSVIAMVKARSESSIRFVEIACRDQDSSALVERIARALGVTKIPVGKNALLQELESYLLEQFKAEHIVAVVVDDAQELDLGGLKAIDSLSELHLADKNLLQIILVGRPKLKTKLTDEALRSLGQRVAVRCQVAGLKSDEVSAYMNHRLSRAGNTDAGLFQPAAVAKIAAYSKGIPGLINVICDRALRSAFGGSQRDISAHTIDKVWRDLQLTGESEFEVAALLTEIRQNSQPSGEGWHFEAGDAKARFRITEKENQAQRPQSDAWSVWTAEKLEQTRRRSRGAVASILLAALLLAGVVVVLFNRPGAKNSNVMVAEQPTGSEASAGLRESMRETPVVARDPRPIEVDRSVKPLIAAKDTHNAPIVYVHTSEEGDRAVLQEIGRVLRLDGFAVRDPRFARSRTQGDVRFFFPQDRSDAERIKSVVQSELGKRGYSFSLQLLERDGKKFENAAPGKIEVWLPPLVSANRAG